LAGEVYAAIEKTADGILRLAGMVKGKRIFSHGRHSHRYVLELLEGCADVREAYRDLLTRLAVKQEALTKETWNNHWRGVVRGIAEVLAGVPPSGSEVDDFLAWKDGPEGFESPPVARKSRDNIYCYSQDGKEVAIRVGSIHSVKGETHTATLVLETFWQDRKGRHNLELLLPWLAGTKSGSKSDGVQQKKRLRLHYVATTRPTHLLCLAMKLSTFKDSQGSLNQEMLKSLEHRGWQVKVI
jgi:DNA helicase-2/ATP-dependent DNA helicase PcrA